MLVTPSIPKKKLTFEEMIYHLEDKNVKFNIINKENAMNILSQYNYFYKIMAYRKNFEKNSRDKYINLEFAFLSDLATIDMRLRYLVLQMSLDIEHAIKTKLLTDITNDPAEDGYSIVDEFLKFDNTSLSYYMKAIKAETHYNHGLYSKHHEKPPVWAFFEIVTFGGFVKFVEFYYIYKNKPKQYRDLASVIKYVKNIRNSAAHNSPILMDIVAINQIDSSIARPITSFVGYIPTISKDVRRKKLTNRKIHDLTALLFVYDKFIISKPMKEVRYDEMLKVLTRSLRLRKHYVSHNGLTSVFHYFNKIVDHLIKKV